jgi:SAM-dependent methyltransferase
MSDRASTMKETEIRPDHLIKDQHQRFLADIRRLLTRQSEFVEVDCPACGSSQRRPRFTKYELRYVDCLECATMYVSPRATPEILADYYAHSENYAYWNQYIFPASAEARREKIFKPRVSRTLEICARHGVGREVLLEVGAGFGLYCEEILKAGAFDRVIGVEPTPDLAQTCRDRGIEIIEKPIEQVQLDVAVDVVANFEVIEHLYAPRDFLQQCARVLKPGGLLIVTCPNVKGFDVQVLQAVSDTVDVEHLNYFHPASLSRLVGCCGFEVIEVSTPGKLDAELVRKKTLAGLYELSTQPFLQELLIERWDELGADFQAFLATHNLSSHMWLVARRNGS